MILFNPSHIVPKRFQTWYRVLRVLLFISFLGTGSTFAYQTLFPSQTFTFSFTNPDTAKNTFEDPLAKDGTTPLRKGRVPANETLVTYAGTFGSFSSAHVDMVLRKDSLLPTNGDVRISLRKSYRSFLFPAGDPILAVSKEHGVTVSGVPYLFSAEKLYPFLSDKAALSRFKTEKMVAANGELLTIFPPQETAIGFREGSFLSDTQGVYAIGGDGKAHPIGSTQVFEALGFHWNYVIPVNEEELGFHKRGKIMMFDAAQPNGTVFHDTATGIYSMIRNGKRLAIENRDYLDSLLAVTTAIDVSSDSLSVSAICTPDRTMLSFLNPTYSCDIPLDTLKSFLGGSFEISLETNKELHIASLETIFQTNPDRSNLGIFSRQIRDRFSAAYGKQ